MTSTFNKNLNQGLDKTHENLEKAEDDNSDLESASRTSVAL